MLRLFQQKFNSLLKCIYLCFSVKESEIQSAEETEEDDVKDDDWLPGSEELEESVEAERGAEVVDSGGEYGRGR